MPRIIHEWRGILHLYRAVERGEHDKYLVGEQSDYLDAMDQPVWRKAEDEAKVIAEGVYFAMTKQALCDLHHRAEEK